MDQMFFWILSGFFAAFFGLAIVLVSRAGKRSNHYSLTREDFSPYRDMLSENKDNRVKKQWLFSFIAFTIASTIVYMFLYFEVLSQLLNYDPLYWSARPFVPLVFFAHMTFRTLVVYHCVYRKRGTTLLLLMIIYFIVPLFYMITLFVSVAIGGHFFSHLNISFFTIVCVYAAYWVNCIRLFRYNARFEYAKLLALRGKYGHSADVF